MQPVCIHCELKLVVKTSPFEVPSLSPRVLLLSQVQIYIFMNHCEVVKTSPFEAPSLSAQVSLQSLLSAVPVNIH